MANGGADSLLVPAVGLDGNGTATGGFNGPDYIMGTGGGGNIGQGNMRALLGQAQGNGGANAPGAALDEGDWKPSAASSVSSARRRWEASLLPHAVWV